MQPRDELAHHRRRVGQRRVGVRLRRQRTAVCEPQELRLRADDEAIRILNIGPRLWSNQRRHVVRHRLALQDLELAEVHWDTGGHLPYLVEVTALEELLQGSITESRVAAAGGGGK